jgi:dTDP-4-dehydrorhamnose reductase
MKILITGGSGALGEYLNSELSKEYEILTLYNNNIGKCANFNSSKTDITNFAAMRSIFINFRPDIVIHSAAISNPEICDKQPSKLVYDVNVNATQRLAELCLQFKAKLIYISTDLVYAGYRGSMLTEDAKLNPISLYAETKLMGEVKIQQTFQDYIILRTSLLFGFTPGKAANHFQNMYLNFRENKPVKLFFDQFRTPLSYYDAARIISQLCQLNIKKEIINLGGKERLSRAQFGRMLCDIAGFNKKLIQKVSMADISGTYKVDDVSLNTAALQSHGIKLKSVKNSIKIILDNIPFDYQ